MLFVVKSSSYQAISAGYGVEEVHLSVLSVAVTLLSESVSGKADVYVYSIRSR